MKRIALAGVSLATAAGAVYATQHDEWPQWSAAITAAVHRVWEGIEANPVPVLAALGTFVLTVLYHAARGKSLRESVEVAATRVKVVPVPTPTADDETPVVRRAKARAMRTQLLSDQIGLENRIRKLPEAVVRAEKDVCFAEQAMADAEQTLARREQVHADAVTKLEALRKELAVGETELAEIEAQLRKLAEVV